MQPQRGTRQIMDILHKGCNEEMTERLTVIQLQIRFERRQKEVKCTSFRLLFVPVEKRWYKVMRREDEQERCIYSMDDVEKEKI